MDPKENEKTRSELESSLNKVMDTRDVLILKGRKMEEGQSYESLASSMGFIYQEYEIELYDIKKNALGAAVSGILEKLKNCSLAKDIIFQIQQRTIAFQIAEFEKELEKLEKEG
jgi:hypothetical protein